jgi:uncharacterized membrane protein YgdD (TMEM256/DUF423 family)
MSRAGTESNGNGSHASESPRHEHRAGEEEGSRPASKSLGVGGRPLSVHNELSVWLFVAALLGGLSVALGAFGAHGLEGLAEQWPEAERQRRLDNWEVGARYQMYHALALAGVAFHLTLAPRRSLQVVAMLFVLGTMIFSGCLYAYTLSGARFWGAIVPIGGTLMIIGWGVWCQASLRRAP